MHVLHLISGGDTGGAKTHVLTLLRGLMATEQVDLVCFMEGPFTREARDLGIPLQVITAPFCKALDILREKIRQEGIQLLHCHGSRGNLMGAILHRLTGVPAVSTVHSDYMLDYMGRPLANMTYGRINRMALKRIGHWIGVSDAMADLLIGRGFPGHKVYCIYNGIAFDGVLPQKTRRQVLQELGVQTQPDTVIFGIAARINPVKDMETLVRAFAKTVAQCPAARLLIAGDGEQRQEIESLAHSLCPPGTVTFAGWIKDVNSFYGALDVNLLTSLSETFPYAITEGARMGCATISSRVGGVPKLIEHDRNGLLFTPRDVDALAGHMLRLARDPALCRRFGRALYEKAKREFSLEATVARQREIYQDILAQAKRQQGDRDGVVICGAFGRGNNGDECILQATISQLREKDPTLPICIVSRNPKRTMQQTRCQAIHTFSLGAIRRQLRQKKVYLSGGGSLIQNATSTRSLLYYLNGLRQAHRQGCKVVMFACGIGPVEGSVNRRLTGKTIQKHVDLVLLRDEVSLTELRSLGVSQPPAYVTADMALLAQPSPAGELADAFAQWGITDQKSYMLFAPRPWQGMQGRYTPFARAAVYAWQRYGLHPVLLAMEPEKDRVVCQIVAKRISAMGVRPIVISNPQDPRLTLGLIGRMQGVVSMRLHGLIFAANQGVPFAGVSYDPKVLSFVERMGQSQCCQLDQADTAHLCQLVDATQTVDAPSLTAEVEALTSLARENCQRLWPLL